MSRAAEGRCHVQVAIRLRACETIPGTELAYGAINLPSRYAQSGTDIANGAIDLPSRPLRYHASYRPTRLLCAVRYGPTRMLRAVRHGPTCLLRVVQYHPTPCPVSSYELAMPYPVPRSVSCSARALCHVR
eukprot:3009821-Rhodomonas_salina.3